MNDDAVCLDDRSALFAGKPRSNENDGCLLEPSSLAMNDNAVCLTHLHICGSGACPR